MCGFRIPGRPPCSYVFQRAFIAVAGCTSSLPFVFSESSDDSVASRSAASAFSSSFGILDAELLSLRRVTQRARRNLMFLQDQLPEQNRNSPLPRLLASLNQASPPASLSTRCQPHDALPYLAVGCALASLNQASPPISHPSRGLSRPFSSTYRCNEWTVCDPVKRPCVT